MGVVTVTVSSHDTVNSTDPAALGEPGGDAVLNWLSETLAALGELVVGGGGVEAATRIERIALLERVKAAVGAVQVAETVKFAQSQVEEQRAAGVDYRRLGRGIGDQIGMATKAGPWHGSRKLTMARDLWFELPGVFGLLVDGVISEYVGLLVVTETSHLAPEVRRLVDQQVVAAGIDRMAPKEAAATARRLAYAADPTGSLRRARTARADRRVSLRPLPETMAGLHAFLPVEQGVACYAALVRHADQLRAAGDPRTRGQIMADTVTERLTGQRAAEDVPVQVHITIPVDRLIDPDDPAPADVAGFGPIPAGLADEIIGRAGAQRWWRRLFTAPTHGTFGLQGASGAATDPPKEAGSVLIGGDAAARRFPGWLATLIRLRDRWCREPFCAAPIRHIDHIVQMREGGPTTYDNGRGVCERHNYVREMPGWRVTQVDADDVAAPSARHTTVTTTPTGHHYLSRAPDTG